MCTGMEMYGICYFRKNNVKISNNVNFHGHVTIPQEVLVQHMSIFSILVLKSKCFVANMFLELLHTPETKL
jgi:hypothetical protein